MAKVIYNGGFQSYYHCTKPIDLIRGKEYEVIYAWDRNWQTDYYLKGVDGHFNSQWFEEIDDQNSVLFQGYTCNEPKIGDLCKIYKVTLNDHLISATRAGKGIIDSVEAIGEELYMVTVNGMKICVNNN